MIRWPFVSRRKYECLLIENLELRKALGKANDNDGRDLLTGRYVSEKKGSFKISD